MEKRNDQYSLPLERKQNENRGPAGLVIRSGISMAKIIRPEFGVKREVKSSPSSHAENCMAHYRIFAEK